MNVNVREQLLKTLGESIPKKQIMEFAPMSRYTTLRLGGPAEVLCEAGSAEEIRAALMAAHALEVPVTLLGNGSNLLVRDGGIRGLVIHIGDGFSRISDPIPLPDGRFALTAQGGATLTKLSNAAADAGLKGLEFAAGIPGTVGGAVYMNAGAYGGEMKDVVTHVTACEADGRNVSYTHEEMQFGYRHSVLIDTGRPIAVTSVTVALEKGDEDTIRTAMREFNARRREKQPVTLPSCGSTFKRPEGYFAGTLIDQCGLKGLRVGGASVSTLHAGFLVNDQQGTAADYLALIAQVQKIVLEKTGVTLEPEVRIIGEDAPVTGA
ncbi:MAG: UDP-N-acetylmuramate dehydrogenase [Clostridia bacterium]|nr:UDP-N-acetylmuramate dehydrogenase [Clostridia bacterium]